MAYQEYDPEEFRCLAIGCGGSVWVTDQKKLHWYHTHSDGERPLGIAKLCDSCEAKVLTATVPCLNSDTGVAGDSGCQRNGKIVIHEQNSKAAFWYVLNGCAERPTMYPYCDACRNGIVYRANCRNRGCRGDGELRCTGDEKQGLLFLASKTGKTSFWPPVNCRPCRDFIDRVQDVALRCSCCEYTWKWSQGRQIMLLRNEPRSAFVQPSMCDGCLSLSEDDRRSIHRRALNHSRQREVRRTLRASLESPEGRRAIQQTSREKFVTAAHAMFRVPDRHFVANSVKAAAVVRVARLGGEPAIAALRAALEAAGADAGRIAAMLANQAITDEQVQKVAVALEKLSAGGSFPAAFAERMKVKGGLGMTTGLAGTASSVPRIAQAAAYELHAAAAIANNNRFPYPFVKSEIASFHYRFSHNRYQSMSSKRSYEGDLVIQQSKPPSFTTTFVDFKHSIVGKPTVTRDEMERIFQALSWGVFDHAVIVSNAPLATPSELDRLNDRIRQLNCDRGDSIPAVRAFVQPW
jgi:hypothetical protein